MACGTCEHPEQSHGHGHGSVIAIGVGLLLIGVALPLYLHVGLGWSPLVLAPAAIVLIHLVIFGAIALFGMRVARSAPGRGSQDAPGAFITRAAVYDRFVRVATLGGEARLRRRTIDLAGIAAGHSVLDVGCGTGTLLLAAAEATGPSGRLCDVEPSPPMAERARAKAIQRGVRVEVVQTGAQSLPYDDSTFDVVLCTMVMHHLPADARAAAWAEAGRVLKPGGQLLVADVLAPRGMSSMMSIVSLAHMRSPHALLDLPTLRRHAEGAGLRVCSEHLLGIALGALVCTKP